mgnify:CR=1 FL=1
MFGLVEWRGAGERCGAREKRLGGVRFLAAGIRRGDGLRAVWSLRTAARTLERYGVTQAVFPRGFSLYERFAARGIVPVDVRPLREAAAAAIASAARLFSPRAHQKAPLTGELSAEPTERL